MHCEMRINYMHISSQSTASLPPPLIGKSLHCSRTYVLEDRRQRALGQQVATALQQAGCDTGSGQHILCAIYVYFPSGVENCVVNGATTSEDVQASERKTSGRYEMKFTCVEKRKAKRR